MLPALFVSHGSPELVLMQHRVNDFLKNLPKKFETPKNIIIISAHWCTKEAEILANPNPELIYDFYGFPRELYEKRYTAKNSMELLKEIEEKFRESDIKLLRNNDRKGYDHGVWTILSLMYPDGGIPIVQLSLPLSFDAKQLLDFGKALRVFRRDSLLIASGNVTHNLYGMSQNRNAETKEYAKTFRTWLVENLRKGDKEELLRFSFAPEFSKNHPSAEHFLPIFIPLGSTEDSKGESLLENYMYGNLAMDTIIFEG